MTRAHNNLGNLMLKEQQLEQAVRHFREALRLDSTYSMARNGLGNAFLLAGNADSALVAYERAIQLEPGRDDFRRNAAMARTVIERQTIEH